MTFDLEKARAADEVLPYPLDAKEIWVSGKGQMHINPPNAPSIFFTLSDLCEFRNIFHGQAAEIERLRSAIKTYREREESAFLEIEMKDEFLTRQNARINELEADLEQSERVIEARLEVIDQQATQIRELQAEGKIGPDADAKPQSWQITEERKAALNSILEYISYDSHDDIEICGHADILRAMLRGAE